VSQWEVVIPVAGIFTVGYTFYRNVVPYPTGPNFWLPIVTGSWILIGLGAVVVSPKLARRIGSRLTEDEGLAVLTTSADHA
jgi:hypothetical protein